METEDDLFDGYPLQHYHQSLSSTEAYDSYSPNTKRKVGSGFDLFCVMRKRTRGGFDYTEKVDDFCCSDSDTDLSECSEFDVISQHVVQDKGLIESESLSICNSPCISEDEGTLVCKLSSDGSTEVRYGYDNLMKLVSKEDEQIQSSSVPPDGGSSSILLDTCSSFQQTVRCLSEYNVHDEKCGLGISPVPLTKTLEGSGRPWSVCGSIAAVRNIPLLGDSSTACSSLDEHLYVNVSTSEEREAELSQTLYQEEVDEMSFSDIDGMIRKLNLIPDDSDSCLDMEERNMSKHPRYTLLGLEHCSVTSIPRGIISQGAIAVLHGRDLKHFIRKQEAHLSVEVMGSRYLGVSRQALVKLENNGSFSLKNLGKRHILVNGEKLSTGQIAILTSCSSVDIRGEVFVFKINKEAVRQFLKNNTRRHNKEDTKFRWCE